MTTLDTFVGARPRPDLSLLPALATAAFLLVVIGGAALTAPAQPEATLEWHGNSATLAR